jgi:hypothetical protein
VKILWKNSSLYLGHDDFYAFILGKRTSGNIQPFKIHNRQTLKAVTIEASPTTQVQQLQTMRTFKYSKYSKHPKNRISSTSTC